MGVATTGAAKEMCVYMVCAITPRESGFERFIISFVNNTDRLVDT